MGYVPVTVRSLKSKNFAVKLMNLGIPTAVIGADFEAIGLQYGRTVLSNFITGEMPFVLTDSTVTTVFAGVNDVITVVSAIGGGAGGGNATAYIDAQIKAFTSDYSTLVAGIRARAPSTRIIVLNVPNVGALPYFAGVGARRAPGAATAVGGIHDHRGQCAHLARGDRRRSDVRCAVVSAVELLV